MTLAIKCFVWGMFLCVGFFSLEINGQENKNLIQFFSVADSISEFPELYEPLVIVCQKKIDSLYVSFIEMKNRKGILIGTVTKKPITNPTKEITRSVDFDGIKPIVGKISTWGYIFDRNDDGRVDYMALMSGAAAFKDEKFPKDFPARGQKYNKEQLKFFLSRCKLIFNHWADDNYNGKLDAVIHIDLDPVRGWAERKIVARCTKFNEKFDDVWAFRKELNLERNKLYYSNNSIPFHPPGSKSGAIDMKMLAEKTAYLELFNRAAIECKLGKNSYYTK